MPFLERRRQLHRLLGAEDGVILWMGAGLSPRNYPDNPYMPFRQNSHFLYYVGGTTPNCAMLSYPDGRDIFFGPEVGIDTVVWTGPQPSFEELGERAGATSAFSIQQLGQAIAAEEDILYIAPYDPGMMLTLSRLFRRRPHEVKLDASQPLVEAVVAQRMKKSPEEIEQIERALAMSQTLFHKGMEHTHTGASTAWLFGMFAGTVYGAGGDFAFPPIVTCHGEILHNHHYNETMEDGRLVLVDMGAEVSSGYASDITRVWPVNGTFSARQRDVYQLVLQAQEDAIAAVAPGFSYRDVHLRAALTIATGLCDLGLMKGDPAEAVAAGAHALFFPHGVGHVMGIDVHDMEDLGDVVGYGQGVGRSEQFGLNFLRLARTLEEGYVVTIEPGVYFIPTLIDLWREEQRHTSFICYDVLESYRDFGGIRIEDDVLVTSAGSRVLGPPIDKQIDAIEERMRGSQ